MRYIKELRKKLPFCHGTKNFAPSATVPWWWFWTGFRVPDCIFVGGASPLRVGEPNRVSDRVGDVTHLVG